MKQYFHGLISCYNCHIHNCLPPLYDYTFLPPYLSFPCRFLFMGYDGSIFHNNFCRAYKVFQEMEVHEFLLIAPNQMLLDLSKVLGIFCSIHHLDNNLSIHTLFLKFWNSQNLNSLFLIDTLSFL